MCVDSAMWCAGNSRDIGNSTHRQAESSPSRMELGNVQHERVIRTSQQRDLRKKVLEMNALFTCHRVRCRPWQHRKANVNNAQIDVDKTEEVDIAKYGADHVPYYSENE